MEAFFIIGAAFALGGILKGATGFGAPLLAVPLLALMFDLPFAITIFAIPNIVTNLWQSWAFRRYHLPLNFVISFVVAGGLGAGIGTYILARTPTEALTLVLASVMLSYIVFRLLRPSWMLGLKVATILSFPLGLIAGLLQGAAGLSAPVSVTFLNSMQLERNQFISTISMFFIGLGFVQVPMLVDYGYLNLTNTLLGFSALLPLIAGMPIGAMLAKRISRERFNQALLVILLVLSLKLLWDSLM